LCDALYGSLYEVRANRGISQGNGQEAEDGALGTTVVISGIPVKTF